MKMPLKIVAAIGGPALFFIFHFFVALDVDNAFVSTMAGITIWMALWWMSEVVHLGVTALIPLIALPLCGVDSAKEVSYQYMDQIIFLFIGGFLLAFALEKWNLHQRIASAILSRTGNKASRILLGVMGSAWLMSMWISNTATVLMLFPAVLSLGKKFENISKYKIQSGLLIGLAFAASIGGMATLVGTPPNMIFYKVMIETYGDHSMNFAKWFVYGLPISILLFASCYFILKTIFIKEDIEVQIKEAHSKEGPLSFEQKCVAIVFGLTALLWLTRSDISISGYTLYGWASIFPKAGFVQDSTVAICMAFFLFLIPSKSEKGKTLLSWNEASRLPFGIILLFGSGFALARGFEISGLSNWLAAHFAFITQGNVFVLLLFLTALICIISEFASNVASIQLMLPILISMQKASGIDPLLLLVPATLAASLGFMMPVATAPNTIVFGSEKIKVSQMMYAGFYLDLAGIVTISLLFYMFH